MPPIIRAVLWLALAFVVAAAVACTPQRTWPGLVKIGLVLPFSAYDSETAVHVLHGVRSAVDEWNKRGGAAGRGVELVALDDWNTPGTAATRARELVADPAVVAVIARLTGDREEAAGVLGQAGLSTVAVGGPLSGQDGLWQMCVDAIAEGRAAAVYANAGAKRPVALVAQGQGYQAAARAFLVAMESKETRALSASGDPARLVAAVLALSPDFVYYSGTSEGGALFAQAFASESDAKLLLGGDASGAVLRALPAAGAKVPFIDPCATSDLNALTPTQVEATIAAQDGANGLLGYTAADELLRAFETSAAMHKPDRRSIALTLGKSTLFDENHVRRLAVSAIR